MTKYQTSTLSESLQRLQGSQVLSAAVNHLAEETTSINEELNQTIISEIPAYSESRNPDVLLNLAQHGPQHTNEILRLLEGKSISDFEFVRKYTQRCAEQHFPLEAILHAYRCSHKYFSRRMRDATLNAATSAEDVQQIVADIADFVIEYTDVVSTIATSAYVSQTRLLADVAGDKREELFTILLEGYDESDGRIAKILREAGYLERRQSYCVALAQSVDPTEMLNPTRARRMADSIDKTLQDSSIRRHIDIRNNKVTIIFSANRRASGWTAPHTALAEKISTELTMVGNAVVIGVSNDVPSTSQIPTAYKEAELALELSNVTHRVVQFSQIPIRRLIQHLVGEEIQRVLLIWANEFFQLDDKTYGILASTLNAYADENMNILKTAEKLGVHLNTIYSRLQKVFDITGLEAKSFHDLSELLIVMDCRPQVEAILG